MGSGSRPAIRRRRFPRPREPPKGRSCQPPELWVQGWGAGSARVAAVASCEAAIWGGGGRGDETLPHPAPPRGGGGHGAAGPNPGQEVGARPSRLPQLLPQLLLPLPTPETRPRASSYSASKPRRRPERGQLRSCVMPPYVLWARPRRREAGAALAEPAPAAVLGLRQFLLLSDCWLGAWLWSLYVVSFASSRPFLPSLVSPLTCALFWRSSHGINPIWIYHLQG